MLTLKTDDVEYFDEKERRFFTIEGKAIDFEHSLVSLSKWESKYEKPFLSKDEKTEEEVFEYLYMMVLTPGVTREDLEGLSHEDVETIQNYIGRNSTATTINQKPSGPSGEVVTSELIYYWMTALQIPIECERWHLNRLVTLVRVANIKQSPPKKMSKGELARRNRELNAQRLSQYGTTG